MGSFEEARHQGYTAADMAADQAEYEQRMQALGCFQCKYGADLYRVCGTIIEDKDNVFEHCPYFRKEV